MDMVYLGHAHVVSGETVHDLRQVAIERKEDVHAHTEVGGIEEGLALLLAFRLYLVEVLQPAGRTGNHRDIGFEATHVVAQCRGGRGKLDRHVGAAECLALEICCIINIYD